MHVMLRFFSRQPCMSAAHDAKIPIATRQPNIHYYKDHWGLLISIERAIKSNN
jgi:hypothetical protein